MATSPDREPIETPKPDPGNSPPEDWAEDLDPDELADVVQLLAEDEDN